MKSSIQSMLIALVSICLVSTSLNANEGVVAAPAMVTTPTPHCEVPCGIYDDQMRFQQMLEDTETIAKAITNINDFVGNMEGPPTAKGINQTMRWVTTKETHATNTQHIIAQYFLTQRIKSDNERYGDQLKAAHSVMVAAMKCKQDADPATAVALKSAIHDLYRAYEGKEPHVHDGDHEHSHSHDGADHEHKKK